MRRIKLLFFVVMSLSFCTVEALAENQIGILKVVSEPSGASIYVNGRVYGPTPTLVELKGGTYNIVVTLDGYPPEKRKVTIHPARVYQAKIVFKKAIVSKSGIRVHQFSDGGQDSGPGTVTITTEPPGLTVVINNTTVPKKTPVAFDIHSGVYRLKILQEGTVVHEKTIFVRAGHTSEYEFAIKRRRNIDDKDPWQ